MFSVNGTEIRLSRGDTGAIKFTANAKYHGTENPYTFGERDRAVFTIKSANGQVVKQRAYPMTSNQFTVVFFNADTDTFAPGGYNWDVRYVINPYYDEIAPDGPWTPYADLKFPIALGQKCDYGGVAYVANQPITAEEAWTEAHWDKAWPAYSDLTFPVATGQRCMHEGVPYAANQAIETSEDWTAAHWNMADNRLPVDGDQVITPNLPMSATLLSVVGDI